MDYHAPRTSVGDRLRIERVARRVGAARFGHTTRNYHRNQQIQDVSFVVLLVLSALGGLLLLAA